MNSSISTFFFWGAKPPIFLNTFASENIIEMAVVQKVVSCNSYKSPIMIKMIDLRWLIELIDVVYNGWGVPPLSSKLR